MNEFQITIEEKGGKSLFRCGDVLFDKLRAEWIGKDSIVEFYDKEGRLCRPSYTYEGSHYGDDFIAFEGTKEKEYPTVLLLGEDFLPGDAIVIKSEEVDGDIFKGNVENGWRQYMAENEVFGKWKSVPNWGRREAETIYQELQEVKSSLSPEILEDGYRLFIFKEPE